MGLQGCNANTRRDAAGPHGRSGHGPATSAAVVQFGRETVGFMTCACPETLACGVPAIARLRPCHKSFLRPVGPLLPSATAVLRGFMHEQASRCFAVVPIHR